MQSQSVYFLSHTRLLSFVAFLFSLLLFVFVLRLELTPLSDVDVRRYLVARKHDVQAAFDQLKATLQWRLDEKVDRILDQPDPHEALFQQHVRHHLMGMHSTGLFVSLFL
jgi:hypothetical protein